MDIVIPLVTVFASGVVAALATYTLNSNKEHVFHRRQKGEDLYRSFIGFSNNLDAFLTSYLRMFEGRITHDTVMEMASENKKGDEYRDLRMLVGIYFPELNGDLQAYLSWRDTANNSIRDYLSHYRTNSKSLTGNDDAKRSLAVALLALRRSARSLENRIIIVAGSVASAEALQPSFLTFLKNRIRATRAIPLE